MKTHKKHFGQSELKTRLINFNPTGPENIETPVEVADTEVPALESPVAAANQAKKVADAGATQTEEGVGAALRGVGKAFGKLWNASKDATIDGIVDGATAFKEASDFAAQYYIGAADKGIRATGQAIDEGVAKIQATDEAITTAIRDTGEEYVGEPLATSAKAIKKASDYAAQTYIATADNHIVKPGKMMIDQIAQAAGEANEDIQEAIAKVQNLDQRITTAMRTNLEASGYAVAKTAQTVGDVLIGLGAMGIDSIKNGADIMVAANKRGNRIMSDTENGVAHATEVPAEKTTPKSKTETVKKGDSLWKIAKRVGFKPTNKNFDAIVAANKKMKNHGDIHPDQKLIIPNDLDK